MSRPHDAAPADREIHEAQQFVAQQEALVRRMIVQGAPTQAAEDRLRQLQQSLSRVKEQRRQTRTSQISHNLRNRFR